MRIKIDNIIYNVTQVVGYEYNLIEVDGKEFYLFENAKVAGEAARLYWEDLAQADPQEFTAIVGEKALIAWGLGQNYAVGSVGVDSLEEWLDLWLDTPEEQWASYDCRELTVNVCGRKLEWELGFVPTVAYRHNWKDIIDDKEANMFLVIEQCDIHNDNCYSVFRGMSHTDNSLREWANDVWGTPLDAPLNVIAKDILQEGGWLLYEHVQ